MSLPKKDSKTPNLLPCISPMSAKSPLPAASLHAIPSLQLMTAVSSAPCVIPSSSICCNMPNPSPNMCNFPKSSPVCCKVPRMPNSYGNNQMPPCCSDSRRSTMNCRERPSQILAFISPANPSAVIYDVEDDNIPTVTSTTS